LRNTDPECEIDMPESEDFVEGGVELSCDDVPPDVGLPAGDDSRPPPPTRPLLQLTDTQLEEFWPSGGGLKALFLDYDGTLREFEAKPEQAVPTPEIRDLLTAINDREDVMPHIISGRNASFLEAHFSHLSRFTLVAEHGFQIWRPENKSWNLWDGTTNHDVWKAAIRSEMDKFVTEMPGSHLEEKASSLVWHYREVKDQPKAEEKSFGVIARLCRLVEDGNLTDVRISHGHKIVEASYQKVRKGPVMRKLCEEKALFGEPYVGVLTAGDDVSDESMFDAAPSDYLTIKVGSAETSARCRVDTPADLRSFLWNLLRRGSSAQGTAPG
jgi:trehalose 6-phosphate synthase/phosphatase